MVNIFHPSTRGYNTKPIFDDYEFHADSLSIKKRNCHPPRSCHPPPYFLLFKHRAELKHGSNTEVHVVQIQQKRKGERERERERERMARGPRLFRRLVLSRWQQSICAYTRYSSQRACIYACWPQRRQAGSGCRIPVPGLCHVSADVFGRVGRTDGRA